MSIYSKLSALLTAANTKTGESDTTLTDAVQTLIDGYGSGGGGGGGGIPSPYSDMATGSFTVASDMTSGDISITHNLGSIPSIIVFYLVGTSVQAYQITQGMRINGNEVLRTADDKTSFRNITGTISAAGYGGADNNNYRGTTSATSTTFKVTAASSQRLFAGDTYRWVAIA